MSSASLKLFAAAGLLLVIAASSMVGLFMILSASSAADDPPAFKTPAWQERGSLLLRREGERGGPPTRLLLKHSARGAVYRYDHAGGRTLTPATEEEWRRAAGAVAECDRQLHPPSAVLDIDPKTNRLLAAGREVRTAGRTVLAMRVSPGGRRVAVVSAAGPRRGSLLPALGAGGASGQHYHEVFSLPEAAPLGEPARLPLGGEQQIITPCWSLEEEFVVYADALFFSLTVIAVNAAPTPAY